MMTVQRLTYIFEYRRSTGELHVEEFDDDYAAISRCFALEDRHRGDDDMEVATLIAEDLDTIKHTHSRYFGGRDDFDLVSHVK